MLFILFDIEVVFFLGWAAVFRDLIKPVEAGGIGLKMLLGALVFLAILEVGHIYAWKKGALDWAPKRSEGTNERENSRRDYDPESRRPRRDRDAAGRGDRLGAQELLSGRCRWDWRVAGLN